MNLKDAVKLIRGNAIMVSQMRSIANVIADMEQNNRKIKKQEKIIKELEDKIAGKSHYHKDLNSFTYALSKLDKNDPEYKDKRQALKEKIKIATKYIQKETIEWKAGAEHAKIKINELKEENEETGKKIEKIIRQEEGISWKAVRERTKEMCDRLGLDLSAQIEVNPTEKEEN